jgi:hypothetical protein
VVTPPEDRPPAILNVDAQVAAIPLTESRAIARFEEHPADACDASRRGHQPMA